jgi:hypothetical protein
MERLHRLIDEKKWTLILRELDKKISSAKEFSDMEEIVWMFENLDHEFREEHAQKYYSVMWKFAFKTGKIKLAKNYAEFILDHLFEHKRIPALKKLRDELITEGLFKTHEKFPLIESLLGKSDFPLEDSTPLEMHPEMWKSSKNILKNYLLDESGWGSDQWKLAYEYVLKFHYDKELFLLLAEKSKQLKKTEHTKKILAFLAGKKVDLISFDEQKKQDTPLIKDSTLNVDYDQLAMDVMSGAVEPSVAEQRRILASLQFMTKKELLEKGKDMVVAFGLLGMDVVVVNLCHRVIPLLKDVKARASMQFMMAQALFNSNEFYKVIDLIDDTISREPLLNEEIVAFNYLKAESFLKLKKYKLAKEFFLQVKRENPQYRLVADRLRHIEEIK